MNYTRLISLIIGISFFLFTGLLWVIYFKSPGSSSALWIPYLPSINALLNTLSAICVVGGVIAITKQKKKRHQQLMVSGLIFSALFLISYILYHHFHGDTPFLATGIIRPIYFFTLISHIVLTVFALPLILITASFALLNEFSRHKKIARWTVPIWLYVSVTGVLIYIFQVLFN
jgi:putative membrane protein